MKKRLVLAVLLAASVLVVGQAPPPAATTTLEWDPPAGAVLRHVIQYRPARSSVPWTEVSVDAPTNRVDLPVSPAGTEFRAAAVNSFGPSPWAGPYSVPAVPSVRLVFDLTR